MCTFGGWVSMTLAPSLLKMSELNLIFATFLATCLAEFSKSWTLLFVFS